MVQIRRKKSFILIVTLLALTAWLDGCGCLIMGRGLVIDEPFTEKKIQMIRHSETTKKDILAWFGPPVAVSRPEMVMKVPHWSKSGSVSEDVPADDFFKRFIATREGAQRPLVYYYEAAHMNWVEYYGYVYNAGGPVYIPPVADRTLTVIRLWILFDEGSGKVVDHQVEKTVEGKPKQKARKKPATNAVGVEIP
jgi:hypothetical protein